jgi:hypothetical protein
MADPPSDPSTLSGKLRRMLWTFVHANFRRFEALGIHVTPNHFYQPIPDTRMLKDQLWVEPSALPGISLDEERQLGLLGELHAWSKEYDDLLENGSGWYVNGNGFFDGVDAAIYYALIRQRKPKRIVEIGAGYSTYVAGLAADVNANEGNPCKITAIEPYPRPELSDTMPGSPRILTSPVNDVSLDEFDALQTNDILFIDSSHVARIGSDVNREILEIVPRLNSGVLVHFHDIYLPYEYPRQWVMNELRFWNEQYMLQAFLSCNTEFEVLWSGYAMHRKRLSALKDAVASHHKHEIPPGSFWIRRK